MSLAPSTMPARYTAAIAAQVARQRVVATMGYGEQKDGLRVCQRRCARVQSGGPPLQPMARPRPARIICLASSGNVDVAAGQCGEHGGEHVGDGVVGARFDLEQRVGATSATGCAHAVRRQRRLPRRWMPRPIPAAGHRSSRTPAPKWANTPVMPAVMTTPSVLSSTAGAATAWRGRYWC